MIESNWCAARQVLMLRSLFVKLAVVSVVGTAAFFVADGRPETERCQAPQRPSAATTPQMPEQGLGTAGGIDDNGRYVLRAHADPARRSANESLATTHFASEREARFVAVREIVRQLETLWLDDGRPLVDATEKAELLGLVAGQLWIVDTVYLADGGVDVVVTFPIALVDRLVTPARVVR